MSILSFGRMNLSRNPMRVTRYRFFALDFPLRVTSHRPQRSAVIYFARFQSVSCSEMAISTKCLPASGRGFPSCGRTGRSGRSSFGSVFRFEIVPPSVLNDHQKQIAEFREDFRFVRKRRLVNTTYNYHHEQDAMAFEFIGTERVFCMY